MIPRLLHLIWVGSSLPNESKRPYRRYLSDWCRLNPSWQIVLWSNPEDMPKNDWQHLREWSNQQGLDLRTIEAFWDHINLGVGLYEAHSAKRFASVSDILRVIILASQGGLYVDFDVRPILLVHTMVPFGAAFCLKFDSQRLRSVVPHAILMAPNHPFSMALLEQLEINIELFKVNPHPWINNPSPEYQYAATVSVTGTIYSLLMRRITGLLNNFDKLIDMQMPYPFVHEEHNSWLENAVGSSLVWRPVEYLEAQLEWGDQAGPIADIEEIAERYLNCSIGE